MAVKKATSATRKGVTLNQSASTKVVASKLATRATVTKTTTKAAVKKVTATKVTATKAAAKATVAKAGTKTTATRATAAKATVAKAATKTRAPKAPATSPRPQRLRVRDNEKPWTAKELAAVRSGLDADVARLQHEISVAEFDLAGLMRDAGDGAGDDQADAGTKTFEREQEISLANNAREMFEQSVRALARIADGSYGVCESCGNPIGKNRLLAFPRATLCLTCKSKQERR